MTASSPTSPYHRGELLVQERAGVRENAAWTAQVIRTSFTHGAAQFLQQQQLAFVSATGVSGLLWCSALQANSEALFTVASPTLVRVHNSPNDHDPLGQALRRGDNVGLTAVDFPGRRRLRLNGVVHTREPDGWTVSVTQVYGNCPKYIRPQELRIAAAPLEVRESGSSLGSVARALLASAHTAVLGTAHPTAGNDASHRGGPPGFLRVVDDDLVEWDDYAGNNMFNSLGNIAADGRASILVFAPASQAVLQLSGHANLHRDRETLRDASLTGGRRVRLKLQWALLRARP